MNQEFLGIKMLADQGNVDAICCLGVSYEHGIYSEKNEEMAFYYIEKAANLGHLLATELLARYYLNGYGVEKDEKKSFFYQK